MRWIWGTLLILVGILYLGINFSWWSSLEVSQIIEFWPMLLILLGLALLVRNWKAGWAIMTAAVLLIIALIIASISDKVPFRSNPFKNKISQNSIRSSSFSADINNDVSEANIDIKTGAVELKLDDTSNKLIEGKLDSTFAEPQLDTKVSNSIASAILRTDRFTGRWPDKNNLDAKITSEIPVNLSLDAGAASLDLDLTNIKLRELDINAGASSINLLLGNQVRNGGRITIDAGASSIEIKVPKEIGAQVKLESPLSSKTFRNFNQTQNNLYQSEGYTDKTTQIEIIINAGVSSISIASE
jgi:hypothetical protein